MSKIGLYLPTSAIEGLKKQATTYCQPKVRTDRISPGSVEETIRSIGQVFDVADEDGVVHMSARLIDAFVTTYGDPDPRLTKGYGFGTDIKSYQDAYRKFWQSNFPDDILNNDTELFVFTYEPIKSPIK